MFPRRENPKRKLFGVALLLTTIFFTFGHTLFSPSVAFADQEHRDEIPHAPDSEDHSPCPTELHQTISIRTTSDGDEHSLGNIDHCAPVAVASDFSRFDDRSISIYLTTKEKLPPRLPLDQKIQLLL